MERRRMMGVLGAMALAAVMGVGADAAEKTKAARAACCVLRRGLRLHRLHLRCDEGRRRQGLRLLLRFGVLHGDRHDGQGRRRQG